MQVPGFDSKRGEWIDYAVKHSLIGFHFVSVPEPRIVAQWAAEHVGITIMKLKASGAATFVVAADFASTFAFDGDNGDVEDFLRERLPELNETELSSEADLVIFRGKTLAIAKKFIGSSHELFAGGH